MSAWHTTPEVARVQPDGAIHAPTHTTLQSLFERHAITCFNLLSLLQARGVVDAVCALHDANRGEVITKEVKFDLVACAVDVCSTEYEDHSNVLSNFIIFA